MTYTASLSELLLLSLELSFTSYDDEGYPLEDEEWDDDSDEEGDDFGDDFLDDDEPLEDASDETEWE